MATTTKPSIARREPRKIAGERVGKKRVDHELAPEAKRLYQAKEEERRKRDARALELRKQGHTFQVIARELNINVETASRAVKRALKEITAPEAEELLKMELERLEGLYAISYAALAKSVQASGGEDPHLGAMDRCLAIMRQKALFMGITDRKGNVTIVAGDQHNTHNEDNSTTVNAIVAAGSKEAYIEALAKAREAHGDNVGTPGTVTPELMPAEPEVITVEAEEVEDDE